MMHRAYKQLLQHPPTRNGKPIGIIPDAYWRGYDGRRLTVSIDPGSIAAAAWKAGKKQRKINEKLRNNEDDANQV